MGSLALRPLLMLNLDFKKTPNGDNYKTVTVDGHLDKDSSCFHTQSSGWYCDLTDQTAYDKLIGYSFGEVGKTIFAFTFSIRQSRKPQNCKIRVACTKKFYGNLGLVVEFEFNADVWARPYSIAYFADVFESFPYFVAVLNRESHEKSNFL